jgi:hypothetical protein
LTLKYNPKKPRWRQTKFYSFCGVFWHYDPGTCNNGSQQQVAVEVVGPYGPNSKGYVWWDFEFSAVIAGPFTCTWINENEAYPSGEPATLTITVH